MTSQIKIFLRRLTIFLFPVLLVAVGIEYSLRILPNSYKLKSYGLNKSANHIETLALGSSHIFYAINPKYFTSYTFNSASISQSPALDLAILKTYEEQLKELKTIIIRLSYDTLFETLKNSSGDWRLKNYKLYTNIEFSYAFRHNSEILSMGVKQCLRTLKQYHIDKKPLLDCDSLGWGNYLSHKKRPDLYEVGIKVAKKHTANNWDLLDYNIANFDKILTWSQKRGVNVIIITPPGYKSYSTNLEAKQLAKMIEVGEYFATKYNNCRYFNFLEREDFDSKDFFDPDHLSEYGAEKFSRIINNLIEN